MQTKLVVLVTVRHELGKYMDNKIGGTAMPRMLDLRDVLEWSRYS